MTTRQDDTAGTAEQIFDVYDAADESDGRRTLFVASLAVAVVAALALAALQTGNYLVAALILGGAAALVGAVRAGILDNPL